MDLLWNFGQAIDLALIGRDYVLRRLKSGFVWWRSSKRVAD